MLCLDWNCGQMGHIAHWICEAPVLDSFGGQLSQDAKIEICKHMLINSLKVPITLQCWTQQ